MKKSIAILAMLVVLISAVLIGFVLHLSSGARCLQDYDSIRSLLTGGVSGVDLYLQDYGAVPVGVSADGLAEYFDTNGYLSVSIMSDCGFVVFDIEAIAAGKAGEVAAAYFTSSGVYTVTFDAEVKQYSGTDESVREWIQSLPRHGTLAFGLPGYRPPYLSDHD